MRKYRIKHTEYGSMIYDQDTGKPLNLYQIEDMLNRYDTVINGINQAMQEKSEAAKRNAKQQRPTAREMRNRENANRVSKGTK